MYRLYWKCIHAFYCIFFIAFGCFLLWLFIPELKGDQPFQPATLMGIIVFGAGALIIPLEYLLHRHKKPWMARGSCLLSAALANIGAFFVLSLLLFLPWDQRNHFQATVILAISLMVWIYFYVPYFYRKEWRPYFYGVKAAAILTGINEQILGRSFATLKYVFTYEYRVQDVRYEGTYLATAVPRLDCLKVGDEIEILYDPKHPDRSVWRMG